MTTKKRNHPSLLVLTLIFSALIFVPIILLALVTSSNSALLRATTKAPKPVYANQSFTFDHSVESEGPICGQSVRIGDDTFLSTLSQEQVQSLHDLAKTNAIDAAKAKSSQACKDEALKNHRFNSSQCPAGYTLKLGTQPTCTSVGECSLVTHNDTTDPEWDVQARKNKKGIWYVRYCADFIDCSECQCKQECVPNTSPTPTP